MTTMSSAPASNAIQIRQVPLSRPFVWLYRGWLDLLQHAGASLAYGAVVTALGGLILTLFRHPSIYAASWSAFLLVGPILTAGLCELSWRQQNNERADFDASLQGFRHNRRALWRFSGLLLAASALWFGLSWLMLGTALTDVAPPYFLTMWGDLLVNLSAAQLWAYLAVAVLLSAAVFSVSVVSVPLIVAHGAEAGAAIGASWRTTLRDFPAMMVWAALIVLLVLVGFSTWLLGMIVVFPLLGHATWHAYQDLIH